MPLSVRQLVQRLRTWPPSGPRWTLRSSAWILFLALGVAMTVGYFLLPTADAMDLYYQLPGMVAVVAILLGIRLHRPSDARPWVALASGLTLSSLGDWTSVLLSRLGINPFPSVADVFYLGGMLVVVVAIVWLARGRIPGGDRASLLDALIVAVGVALLTWVFLMAPIVSDTTQSLLEIAVALAYPAIDILLLGIMVRLILAPGSHVMAVRLLIGALVAFLLADYPYAFLSLSGGYYNGNIIDAGWMIGAVLWGAAALHPSMARIAEPVQPAEVHFGIWRLGLLAGASLMAPAVLVIEALTGGRIDVPVVATGCVVLFLLVIARLDSVVGQLRTTLDQRRLLETELERRALHDPLTGLANRVLFHDRLEHALCRREGNVAVMFIDLDDFKTVNDAHGHAAGDRVLTAVAESFRSSLRPGDTVARLGGDEFAILLAESPDRYEAGVVAGRLLRAAQVPVNVGGFVYSIGASIGISLAGTASSVDAASALADDLMRDADIAMYVAKGQGKGTFIVFEATEHKEVVRGIELRTDLETAISEEQFELEYQPIIDLESGVVAGVEALVRWRHPTLGLLAPAEFIPLAETTGAIVPLGRWILSQACRHAVAMVPAVKSVTSKGVTTLALPQPEEPEGPYVSVNLSAVQIADPGFADTATEILAASGLAPGRLVLELTETARLDHIAAGTAIHDLRAMGVRLAIDDFGTGFASLSQLRRTPFDILKIDRSFVTAVATDARDEAVVTGILDLARRLEVEVVAEGIEDGVQLARLRAAGCGFGQGFHFAEPMRLPELRTFLREHAGVTDPGFRVRARARRGSLVPDA
ncbi:MAG: EAL domain-containing protein [Chloroflexota bacterium]